LVVVFLVLLVTASAAAPGPPSQQSSTGAASQEARDQAQAQATIGHNELHLARLSDAQANCDSALNLDPANETAKDCLSWVAFMLIDQDLNSADTKLLSGDKPSAIALASKWARAGAGPEQRKRAWKILSRARSASLHDRYVAIFPAWLREMLVTIIILTGSLLFLFAARNIWREWERGKWYGDVGKTKWSMLPLRELPAADVRTGIPTDEVLDALARLGHELTRELWEPKSLLLRPTPPANYEPALISDFLSSGLRPLVLVPAAKDLRLEWQLHEVQLDQAMQNLQLKTASGIDIGSVARFLRSIVEWLNAGAPKISGVAQTGADSAVSIHLAATGGRAQLVAVTASTSAAPGVDPTYLSAERAALKFLFRMRYPSMTNDEIDGFSALRQGACQFAQFAGTVRGTGEDAKTRKSILAKAAFNLGFFRASIPPHCAPMPPTKQCTSLAITDEIRQAVLLAEGVAHALVGEDSDRILAIDCFRQLEDWPGSEETSALRQQATYNEAVVWREMGSAGHCVLMLTELLGERAPDTVEEGRDESTSIHHQKPALPESIRFPVRLARLAAFATYNREEWRALPRSRAKLLIDDAEKLIKELGSLRQQENLSPQDHRLVNYMYLEALRAIGHVEMLRIITGPAAIMYRENRPTGLKDATLSKEGSEGLRRAIEWMLTCEKVAPSCDLFCDLAEAYLLLKEFTLAEGYARHATLESNPYYERAYYIATESFFLQNTDNSKALAKKYAEDFKGTVKLAEFKSVRADLDIRETPAANSAPNPPP
jgi:tetratricopeptide (TPR) repeat protein